MDRLSLIDKEITFIESLLDEDLIIASETLIETHAPHAAPPKTKVAPWSLTVKDQSFHYEVYVSIDRDRITKYSCNCIKYQQGQLCVHVVSSLIIIRKIINSEALKKADKAKPTGSRTLVKTIVAGMNKIELSQFILDYTKREPIFKMLLLARQYEKLTLSERIDLIEKSFPPVTAVGQKPSAKNLNSFLAFNEEMSFVYNDFIGHQNYVDAYNLTFRLLKKSFYIKSKLQSDHVNFVKNHIYLLGQFTEITEFIEAPEFKEEIDSQIIELITSSYISANIAEEKLLWIYVYHKEALKAELQNIIAQLIGKGKDQSDLESYYFFCTLDLLLTDKILWEQKINSIDSQKKYRIIQNLLTLDTIASKTSLLSHFIIYTDLNAHLIKQIINHLPQEDLSEELENRLIELYARHEDSALIKWLMDCGQNRKDFEIRLENKLSEYPSKDLIIQYKLLQKRPEEAIRIIKENLSLELLSKYDIFFNADHFDDILALYKEVCLQFMNGHFGPASKDFLVGIYTHLDQIGAQKIKRNLQTFIKEEFSTRQSLKVD